MKEGSGAQSDLYSAMNILGSGRWNWSVSSLDMVGLVQVEGMTEQEKEVPSQITV